MINEILAFFGIFIFIVVIGAFLWSTWQVIITDLEIKRLMVEVTQQWNRIKAKFICMEDYN